MEQITLFPKNKDHQNSPESKFNFQELVSPPIKQRDRQQSIQPWLEDTDNPFLNFKDIKTKGKTSNPKISKIKQENSPLKQYKSTEKVPISRQSKILPVMNIGKLNTIRKGYFSHSKLKFQNDFNNQLSQRQQKTKTINSSELLPYVQKQLMIERKIFLIKSGSQNSSPMSSPERKSRIRNIISEVRKR